MRRTFRRRSVETEATIETSLFRMAALYHNAVAENAANTHIVGRSVERKGAAVAAR